MVRLFNQWLGIEDVSDCPVRPTMKTKHLFGLVAVVATVGLASSAQAGVSVNFSFGLPLPVFHAPRSVAVYTPCPPPVAYCPPPVVQCAPPVVYQTMPRRSVVYVAPTYGRHYDYRDQRGSSHGRHQSSWGRDNRGHDRGGRR
jgi:hypothetical protein